jgi:hypothetical protein
VLVFGDRTVTVDPGKQLRLLARRMAHTHRRFPGFARHDALVADFVLLGALAQGLIDAEFEARGEDDLTLLHQRLAAALVRLAHSVARSWRTGFAEVGEDLSAEVAQLAEDAAPASVVCKTPEGFSVYGVYSEAYAQAARELPGAAPRLFLGLRSIGLSLAAAAAAGAGGGEVISLRPVGDPSARTLRPSQRLRDRLQAHPGLFVIVDEGPGQSGSSFGAAADLLQELGVEEGRIAFMPSHGNPPGPTASDAHRARWARASRVTRSFEDLLQARPIGSWFEDLIGEVLKVEDLSAGAWRKDLPHDAWPPAWRLQERRKFRLTTRDGAYVARFAGLGDLGAAKFRRARRLHAAGFTPEPVAIRGGMLLERWIDGRMLAPADFRSPRMLEHLGAYLGFRARRLPAAPGSGADGEALVRMSLRNAELLGGAVLRDAVATKLQPLPRLRLKPVEIDGHLHPWEWREDAEGRIWKADAVDQAWGHDLVGCQDIAWDLAGAAVEFDLSPAATAGLVGAVGGHAERAEAPEAAALMQLCYCAFQAGLWTFAADDPQESVRARQRRDAYHHRLERLAFASI